VGGFQIELSGRRVLRRQDLGISDQKPAWQQSLFSLFWKIRHFYVEHTRTMLQQDFHPEWFDVSLSILIQQGLVEETDDWSDVPHYKLTAEGMKEGKQAKEAMYRGKFGDLGELQYDT
jgi:hypothetical protein